MLDQRLESQLRSALRDEGDQLAFTITAAELERRLVLRRRSRLSPVASLGLAAAMGIALFGLAALAGGWFEQRAPVVPTPSSSTAPSTAPSATVSPTGPIGATLPALEDFVAPLDPARIVRAQSVGPSVAPTAWSHGLSGPGTTSFAPVTSAGSYRVWLACLGSDQVTLRSVTAGGATPPNDVPIACDGSTSARDVGLGAGDSLAILASEPTSWRFVLLAPDRPAPHAESIAKDVTNAAGPRLESEAVSDLTAPVYGAAGSPAIPGPRMLLNGRDAYRIALSCAGPGPMTYALRPSENVSPPVGAGAALAEVATVVECDGDTHVDVVRFPFVIGADVWIDAPSGTAWRMAVAFEDPPISAAKDGKGWTLGIGIGPNLLLHQSPEQIGSSMAVSNRIRLVVTCLGGTSADVVLRDDDTGIETSVTAQCRSDEATETVAPVDDPGRRFTITMTPHGAMWLAVAIQQASPPVGGG